MENTLISIEMIDGKKHIHYLGYGYSVGEELEEGKPARWVDYTFFYTPLKAALDCGIAKFEEENSEFVKQYIEDLTYEELDERNAMYPVLKESEITMDTPCGEYFIEREVI